MSVVTSPQPTDRYTRTLIRQFVVGDFVNDITQEICHSSSLHIFVLCCFFISFSNIPEVEMKGLLIYLCIPVCFAMVETYFLPPVIDVISIIDYAVS
jgi:hypothetical protein